MPDGLEGGDGATELLPGGGVLGRHGECSFGHAQLGCADAQPEVVQEGAHRRVVADGFGRRRLEGDLPDWLPAGRGSLHPGDASGRRVDQGAPGSVRASHGDEDERCGVEVFDHHLGPVQEAVLEGRGGLREAVVQELLDGDGEDAAAGDHVGEQALALLVGPVSVHDEGGDRGGEQWQGCHMGSLDPQQQGQGHGVQTAAAHVGAEGDAEEAGGGEVLPELPVEPSPGGLHGNVPTHVQMVAHDASGQVHHRLLGLRRGEVHGPYLASAWRRCWRGRPRPAIPMMSRCTSLVPPPKVSTQTLR